MLPHSYSFSTVVPSHLISSESSIVDPVTANAIHLLNHLDSECPEDLPSVLDHSNASVTESLCSDASVDESMCSNGDVALQRDIQQIIHEHSDNVIKKWGNSE